MSPRATSAEPPDSAAQRTAIDHQVDADRLRILLEHIPAALAGSALLSLGAAWFMAQMVSPTVALIWLGGKTLAVLPRCLQLLQARGRPYKTSEEVHAVFRRMRWLVALDGLVWGMLAWAVVPLMNLNAAVVALSCLLGLASVAAYSLAVDFRTMAWFIVPILAPNVVFCATRPDLMGQFGAMALTAFLGALIFQGQRLQGRMRELLQLRFVNERIAQEREVALAESFGHAEARSRFLATVSHEMRTPLHGMLGLARLLQRDRPRPEQAHQLSLIERSGEHLLLVINDVLDFSKIEAGRMEIQHRPFDLTQELQEATSVFQVLAHRKKLTLTLTLAWDGPCPVIGDAGRLRQVLHNLLGNAVKFTEHGSVHLLAQRLPDSDDFELIVRDSGPGIPLEDQVRIFEAFTQVQSSLNRRHEGTGLGLSIARQLCQAMGGDLTCDSTPGRGAVFRARVRCPRAEEASVPSSAEPAPHVNSAWLTEGACVLLVEDNPVNVLVAEAMLRNLGYEVFTVTDGRQAVAWLENDQCDVVLMDCAMPVMDGFEATRQIRQREGQTGRTRVPIVALTANVLSDERSLCLEVGMDDHLAKPFESDDLRRVVQRCMTNAPLLRVL